MRWKKRTIRATLVFLITQCFFVDVVISQITYLDLSGIDNSTSLSNVTIGSTGETFSASMNNTGSPDDPGASSNGNFELRMNSSTDVQCLDLTFSAGMYLYITDETTDNNTFNRRDSLYVNNTTYYLVDPDDKIDMRTSGSNAVFAPNAGATSYTTWNITFGQATSIQVCGLMTAQSPTKNKHVPIRIGVSASAPLPVELIEFRGTKNLENAHFYWKTATEVNNDFFTLERSNNGKDWQPISTVNGSGTTLQEMEYSTVDYSPIGGTSFYRLKQTDYDGAYDYSDVITIDFDDETSTTQHRSPYPNPCRSTITFDLSESKFPNFQVIGSRGQNVTNQVNYLSNGTFEISKLTKGIYQFRFKDVSHNVLKK